MFQEQPLTKNHCSSKELDLIFNSEWISSFYVWSEKQHKWVQQNQSFPKNFQSGKQELQRQIEFPIKKINQLKEIKSVTLNVLFDFRSSSEEPDKDRGHMKFSTESELQKMACDVITLNQVTRSFVKMIETKQWVKKSYKISTCHDSPYGINGIKCFGNIILTKLQPLALHVYKVPSLPRPIPIGFFVIQNYKMQIITFSSIHLIAYDINFEKRQKELTSIKTYLNKFNFCATHVLQGDMNFHSQKENINVENNKLQDCWFKVYKISNQKELELNPGYTFDSEKNYFIKELYWGFEKRKMRLDRILISNQNKTLLEPKQMKVVFDRPVFENQAQEPSTNILKGAISFLGDRAKWNLFRSKENYLFPSDHFGLECIFQLL